MKSGIISARFCILLIFCILSPLAKVASAATIELARGPNGKAIVGLKVEGDILRGDALKLLGMYRYYGADAASTIFLLSKGGDVEEAMTMGRLIRTLRLETWAPLHIQLPEPSGLVMPDDKDNFICASACFLIYAGGVQRHGDFLVLHRPYFSKSAVLEMSDVEQESRQRKVMAEVRDYLQTMEVDQYYIDKMMSISSQDGYVVTGNEIILHPLEIIVPSIEEIVLSRCEIVTMREIQNAQLDTTPEGRKRWTKLSEQWAAGLSCEERQLESLRQAAWDREHFREVEQQCRSLGPSAQERQILMDWYKIPKDERLQSTPENQKAILQIFSKENALQDCRSGALLNLTLDSLARWRNAPPGASLPPNFEVNPFEVIELEQGQAREQ
jgi:hypothetical protein